MRRHSARFVTTAMISGLFFLTLLPTHCFAQEAAPQEFWMRKDIGRGIEFQFSEEWPWETKREKIDKHPLHIVSTSYRWIHRFRVREASLLQRVELGHNLNIGTALPFSSGQIVAYSLDVRIHSPVFYRTTFFLGGGVGGSYFGPHAHSDRTTGPFQFPINADVGFEHYPRWNRNIAIIVGGRYRHYSNFASVFGTPKPNDGVNMFGIFFEVDF